MFTGPDHKYEHRRMTRHIDIVIIRAISVHSLIVIISTLVDNINPTSLFSLALQLFVPESGSDDKGRDEGEMYDPVKSGRGQG